MPLEKPAVAPQKSRILVAITATALLADILLSYAPRGRSFALLAEAPAQLARGLTAGLASVAWQAPASA